MKTFRRILIANRGEIAVRIIRTLRDMGIESVAIYSDADRLSAHVAMADYAIHLSGVSSSDTYLNIPAILSCIQESHADAVHPGYGFLSENSDFAEAVAKHTQAQFIGPSVEAIRLMGDKLAAKKLMQAHKIPILPGSFGEIQNLQEVEQLAKELGYPIILKASAGGGGRGIRFIHSKADIAEAYESCRREAQAYFGNPSLFCERYIQNPRHIEFQVLFDRFGHGVHLFERDCTIQRRHQKLFEEAPSRYLNSKQREHFGALAVKAASLVQYSGVGTVEFICESPEQVYFMEMNTRIQVEHPITEQITGIDLIKEQILVAAGHKLTHQQADIPLRGWSMEARINAEDPLQNFAPSPGKITHLQLPMGPHVRVDTHLYPGYEVPSAYDSLLAKVIVWGHTREEAIERLKRSLREFDLSGIQTSIKFHEALLQDEDFLKGQFSTNFVELKKSEFLHRMNSQSSLEPELAAVLASVSLTLAFADSQTLPDADNNQFWIHKARAEACRE